MPLVLPPVLFLLVHYFCQSEVTYAKLYSERKEAREDVCAYWSERKVQLLHTLTKLQKSLSGHFLQLLALFPEVRQRSSRPMKLGAYRTSYCILEPFALGRSGM